MKAPSAVFDTNIFISALVYGGVPTECVELARDGSVKLYISTKLLLELAEKLREKFSFSEDMITDGVVGISAFSQIVVPTEKVDLIGSDPDDNIILEIAKEIGADYIVSGDKKHILPLGRFGKTKIVTASEFVKANPLFFR